MRCASVSVALCVRIRRSVNLRPHGACVGATQSQGTMQDDEWQRFCYRRVGASDLVHVLCGRHGCDSVSVASHVCDVVQVNLDNELHVEFEAVANACAQTDDQVIVAPLARLIAMTDERLMLISPVTRTIIEGLRDHDRNSSSAVAYLSKWRCVRRTKTAVVYDATFTVLHRSRSACLFRAHQQSEVNDRQSSGWWVKPPTRDEAAYFWGEVDRNLATEIARTGAAAHLATFFPHQTRNAARCAAKELLGLSAYKMVHHSVFTQGTEDSDPSAFVEVSGLGQTVLLSRRHLGRAKHTTADKVFTFILDDVGTGKTRAALGAVLLGGPRGENPFDLRPAHAAIPWSGTRHLPDTRLNCAPFGAYARTLRNLATVYPADARAQGGTLVIIQHNMIDHWLREVRELWHGMPALRVGVLGAQALSRDATICADDVASNYDLVLAPSTLLSKWRPLPNQPAHRSSGDSIEFVDEIWPIGADGRVGDDGACYAFLGMAGPIGVTVFASSVYMADNFDASRRQLVVRAHQDLLSPHLAIYRGTFSAADVASTLDGSALDGTLMARLPRPQITWRWTICARDVPAVAAATFDRPDASTRIPPIEALLRVRWHRLIVDELHLFRSARTKKRAFLNSLSYRSFVGLTAQRESRVVHAIGLFEHQLADAAGYVNRHHHSETYALDAQLFVQNSIHNEGAAAAACAPPQVNAHLATTLAPSAQAACAEVVQHVAAAIRQAPRIASNFMVFLCLAHALKDVLRYASVGSPSQSVQLYVRRIQAIAERALVESTGSMNTGAGAGGGGGAGALERQDAMQMPDLDEDTQVAREVAYTSEGGELCCPVCFDTCSPCSDPSSAWVVALPCLHILCRGCFETSPSRSVFARCVMCRGRVRSFGLVVAAVQGPTGGQTDAQIDRRPTDGQMDGLTIGDATGKAETLVNLVRACADMEPTAEEPDIEFVNGIIVFCECTDSQIQRLREHIERQTAVRAEAASSRRRIRVFGILASMDASRRAHVLEAAQALALAREPDVLPVVIVRYRMCAVGIDLTFANHCVLYNMPHRHDYLHQAVGRLCRIGQRAGRVHVWPVLYENSFEALVWTHWRHSIDRAQGHFAPLSHIAARYLGRT